MDERTFGGLRRQELTMAAAEVAGLLAIFLVAFTGRSALSDEVKTLLTMLSVLVGSLGILGGLVVARRGVVERAGRFARFGLGLVMALLGGYTIVHVLS
jgi:hypothetical protein